MDRLDVRRVEGLVTLFVDNLPFNMSNIGLRQLFMNVGDVMDTFVSRKNRKGVEGAFGFVRFQKEGEAKKAISKNNNLVINGRKILVQLSKYARTKVAKWGEVDRSWADKPKNTGTRGQPQSGLFKSYANVVNNTMRAIPLDLQEEKNGGTSQNHKGVCLSEKELVEGWVKLLTNRDCVEEKITVNVGDKTVIVHSILANSVVESKAKEMVGDESVENIEKGYGSEKLLVDPIVQFLMNGFEEQLLGDCERVNGIECLFPEIDDAKGKQDNGFTSLLESSGMIEKMILEGKQVTHEDYDRGSDKGDQRAIKPTFVSTDSGINGDSEDVVEYNGPWAPGYFKGSCVGSLKGTGEKSKGDNSHSTSSDQKSCNNLHSSNDSEDEGQSNVSDLSLPLGFASTIPAEVIKTAKMKKKKEIKMKNGKSSVKISKDGSVSVTNSSNKSMNMLIDNPITVKGVMDFALLMGLNIEGKEIETQRHISKILQEERDEWEKFQVEKQRKECPEV